MALFLAFVTRYVARASVRLIADGYYPPPYPAEPGLSSTHGPTKMNVASIPHAAAVWPASLSILQRKRLDSSPLARRNNRAQVNPFGASEFFVLRGAGGRIKVVVEAAFNRPEGGFHAHAASALLRAS